MTTRLATILTLGLALAGGCAATDPNDSGRPADPNYLASGPTVGLEGGDGERKPTALELLDRRNRELADARAENEALANEKSKLEAEGARLVAEIAELRARAEKAERGVADAAQESRSLKESLVRSRLMNVRLSQHLARLDLGIGDDEALDAKDGDK